MFKRIRNWFGRRSYREGITLRMNRRSVDDIVRALYDADDAPARFGALATLVIDLLVEVEALRGAVLGTQRGDGGDPVHGGYDIPSYAETLAEGKGAYSAAYVDAAYVLHNEAGLSNGLEKLLARFYPAHEPGPREALMLKRLGFSDAEIARFLEAAQQAEAFT